MDIGQIAVLVGTGLGAAAASFGATLLTFGRPVKNRVENLESSSLKKKSLDEAEKRILEKHLLLDNRVQALSEAQAVLKEKCDQLEGKAESQAKRIDQTVDRMVTLVTDEEFQAHAGQTATSLNALTDKVGRAIGALEAWRDRGR